MELSVLIILFLLIAKALARERIAPSTNAIQKMMGRAPFLKYPFTASKKRMNDALSSAIDASVRKDAIL